jgi:hypothetical protein
MKTDLIDSRFGAQWSTLDNWRKGLAVLAAASIPVTIFANSYDFLTVSQIAEIGAYNFTSSYYYSWAHGLLVVGNYNNITSNSIESSLVAGQNLNLYDGDNQIILGRWNRNIPQNELFVIGNGTGPTDTKNEVEIWKDGTIKIGHDGVGQHAIQINADGKTIQILPQGDIGMGIYAP